MAGVSEVARLRSDGERTQRARILANAATVMALLLSSAIAADPAAPLSKIIRGAPVVTVARPLVRNFADHDFLGRIEPAAAIELRAPVSGRVAKVGDMAGADVAAGDVLIELDRAALRAELDVAEAVVERRKAAVEQLDRQLTQPASTLGDANRAVLQARRDVARSQMALAASAVDRARNNLELCVVRSPVAGRLTRLLVAEGDRVIADVRSATLLGVLQPTNPVLVTFAVDESTCLRLRQGTDAQGRRIKAIAGLPVEIALTGEIGWQHQGTVDYASPTIDPRTGTATFQAALPNTTGAVTPALFVPEDERQPVRVRMTIGESKPRYLIPAVAVGTDAEGNRFVLVVNDHNVIEKRGVRVDGQRAGMPAIADGLTADDRVVIAAERTVSNSPNATLTPEDFAADLRLLRARPGLTVLPVEIALPDPEAPPESPTEPAKPAANE
jgi:RND family efflux transporter MFP subunit